MAVVRELGRPGDLGWVVMAHGELYAREFGWDTSFEALVARIVADYAAEHDDARERHGLGRRLVGTCVEFARERGYERLKLWTNHPLEAARSVYLAHGFVLVAEEPHHSFGVDLVGQTYELVLR